jgi:hypothetical protein
MGRQVTLMHILFASGRIPDWLLGVQAGALAVLILCFLLRRHSRSDWSLRRIRSAFRQMDALDAREAPEAEYAPILIALDQGLPAWGAAYAADRLAQSDCRSRKRCLAILAQSDLSRVRERLVDLARDSSDSLAPEIWEILTGRHRSEWRKALLATDGRAGFADPPPPPSGPWCGFYTQFGAEHRMLLSLRFDGASFWGEGADITGPFTITGTIVVKRFRATKRYNLHSVEYEGGFDGDAIEGRWTLVAGSGSFRFWPRRQPPQPVKS